MEKRSKYWVRFIITECPVCGRGDEYRERVYDKPKPIDPAERYKYEIVYDWCDAL